MHVVPFSQFGKDDVSLYEQYLRAVLAGRVLERVGDISVGTFRGLSGVELGAVGDGLGEVVDKVLGVCQSGGSNVGIGEKFCRLRIGCVGGDGDGQGVARVGIAGTCGDGERVLLPAGEGSGDSQLAGERVDVGSARVVGGALGESCVVDVGETSGDSSDDKEFEGDVYGIKRGKHYERNKEKKRRNKLRREMMKKRVPSLSGSVCTVDTRTAGEIEAVETLAARRVAENKVARRLAELKLVSLADKDKTEAIRRLEAARMEQKINEARFKSQVSFKKCDASLKSLGSTGSAGEFALKREVKKNEKNGVMLKYANAQLDFAYKFLPAEAKRALAEMPEPVFPTDMEVFGDCASDLDENEREEYYQHMTNESMGLVE